MEHLRLPEAETREGTWLLNLTNKLQPSHQLKIQVLLGWKYANRASGTSGIFSRHKFASKFD